MGDARQDRLAETVVVTRRRAWSQSTLLHVLSGSLLTLVGVVLEHAGDQDGVPRGRSTERDRGLVGVNAAPNPYAPPRSDGAGLPAHPPRRDPFAVGDVIAGEYKLTRVIHREQRARFSGARNSIRTGPAS
jgi:hypothetical protein